MENQKLEIIIAAKDLASGVINQLTGATRAYHNTLRDLSGTASAVSGAMSQLVASMGGAYLFANIVKEGYRFNMTLEDTRAGIATLVYSMREFKDASGNVAVGQKAFDSALSMSADIQEKLRVAALTTKATYEELINAFTQSYVPALDAGFDEGKVVRFSQAIAQAAAAMSIPMNQLGEEVRSILTGMMEPKQTRLQPLFEAAGLDNNKIKELRANGKLYEAVMKALEGASFGAAVASDNLSVKLSNLKDAVQQAMGKAMSESFRQTKQWIDDATASIVVFDKKTGDVTWNEDLLTTIRDVDRAIVSAANNVVALGKGINAFTREHPAITGIVSMIGEISVKAWLGVMALRGLGSIFTWLKAHALANIAFIATLLGGVGAAVSSITIATGISSGVFLTLAGTMQVVGAAAGVIGAAMAGWMIGKKITEMEILGLTIGEAMQAGYASIAKFGAYAVYTWDMIGATAKSVWGQVKEAGKILFYEFIATIQESFPKMAQFFGLTEDYRKKADSARSSQSAIYQDFIKNQTAAEGKLKQELNLQESIREEIFRGADARNRIKNATDSATKSTEELTAGSRKGKAAAVEYNLSHEGVNQTLDRMTDTLKSAKEKILEFASEIKKLTATSHGAKLIDIEDAYRKDMAAVEKYKTDMDRAVRELQEKISKAQKDAAKKNAKRDANDPITAVDPAVHADAQNMLKLKQELITNVEILERQAREKRDIAVAQENAESLASVRSFVATQTQEYTQLTGNVRAGYKAEADALRAKLAEELADVKISAEKKAAITLLYNEKIRQAEVVKPGEYDRAAREAEINNSLARLDLIEAEGTAHRNTINERIRLTEELISLQRQSLAAMPKTGNEQAWNAQMDKIIADQKKRAELVREQLMNSPIEAMKLGFKDLFNKWTDVGQQMYEVSQSTATAMRDAFSDIFFDAFQGKLKSIGDYITSFVGSVNKAIANYLANMAAAGLIGVVRGYFSVSAPMNNGTEPIHTGADMGGGATTAFGMHSGGIAGGQATFSRMVPNLAFAAAPRFHGGFAPDEYPAVLQRGEGVFTAGQMKALGFMANRGSLPRVTVNIDNQTGTQMETEQNDVRFDHEQLIINVVAKKAKSSPDFRSLLATGGRG